MNNFRINITEGGKRSLLELSGGDLRRVLNLLQSANMAYPEITEDVIYLTAGAAQPTVIDSLLTSLMSDTFDVAYRNVCKATSEFGYALVDINTALSLRVAELEMPNQCIVMLMDKLSNVEYRLSHGVNEKMQIGSLVGAFILCRNMMTAPSTGK
jgi:replication factor C subunit 3/5